jgi:hypothetical protein
MIRAVAVLLFAACLAGFPGMIGASPDLVPISLSGTVGDRNGTPLPGASVRVYRAGRPTVSARTDPEGGYRLEFSIDPDEDETVLVWWVSPRTDLVSDLALVRESARDRDLGLWGPCVPRIGAIREQTRSVRLLDAAEFRSKIAEQGCAR